MGYPPICESLSERGYPGRALTDPRRGAHSLGGLGGTCREPGRAAAAGRRACGLARMANRIPSDQTIVVVAPEERRGMVFDALSIQSIIESPVLQSQRSTLLGPLMFVPDRTPGVTPRFLCYANYRDAGTCLLAFEGFQAWLLTRDWCHEVTAYIKQSGPPAQRVMIPADQTLVVKGVPEDKKELIVLALQKQTAGIMGTPNFVPDKASIAAIGAPAQFHCYANYVDAQRCLEAVVGMEAWRQSVVAHGDWARHLVVSVKVATK